jgi:hypothetical protein
VFKDLNPCFVRVLTTDGLWLGGWFGEASYVSTFPEPREMFIEVAHEIDSAGRIGRPQEESAGMYLRCDDIRAVEMSRPSLPLYEEDEGGFYVSRRA